MSTSWCPCAAPEGVYTQRPVLLLDMSTYTTKGCAAPAQTCLHHRGRSCTLTCLHCRGLPFFWRCLHYRGLSCIWTCLRYRSLCCTWTCLHHKGPEEHLDLSTLQRAVQLLEVSTQRSLSCLWTCLHFSGLCWSWAAYGRSAAAFSREHLL